jgi:hypothetical protein
LRNIVEEVICPCGDAEYTLEFFKNSVPGKPKFCAFCGAECESEIETDDDIEIEED